MSTESACCQSYLTVLWKSNKSGSMESPRRHISSRLTGRYPSHSDPGPRLVAPWLSLFCNPLTWSKMRWNPVILNKGGRSSLYDSTRLIEGVNGAEGSKRSYQEGQVEGFTIRESTPRRTQMGCLCHRGCPSCLRPSPGTWNIMF